MWVTTKIVMLYVGDIDMNSLTILASDWQFSPTVSYSLSLLNIKEYRI